MESSRYFVQVIVSMIFLTNCSQAFGFNIDDNCPRIFHQVFNGYAPLGNINAGNFSEYPKITTLLPCIASCCQHNTCNVAFIFNETCYQVQCSSNDLCMPARKLNVTTKLQMVLVNPVTDGDSWMDVLKAHDFDDIQLENRVNPPYFDKMNLADALYGSNYFEGYPPSGQYVDDGDLQMDESKIYSEMAPCQMGLKMCPVNEKCVQLIPQSRQGVCNCIQGYERDERGVCVSLKLAENLIIKDLNGESESGSVTKSDSSEKPSTNKLVVSVVSKTVRLPEKEATLIAYTVPDEQASGDTYKYLWSLITQPSDAVNGTMSDQTKDKILLSNLSEGLYRFKVVVTGSMLKGEAYANVTVLPEKRINTPPQVIITPQQQTLKLPTSKAILDGSTSKDDDQIVNWHWDLISGPIGYEPTLPETSTLQLSDLTSPGNYTFRLTVTDSDKAKNSTTATISLLKASDYPPEANAGADVILYLPHNNVTLNGSQSTDDREIVAWEWTKDASDVSKAVDMQNTRTPYLELSNLEEGIYAFELKVTDASNQSSTAKVHVFVKAPTNLPPVANAGQNSTINLPQTWAVLNGSQSTDDIKIIQYLWKLVSGPTVVTILNSNASIANATGMTIGSYSFELSVIDENKNNASDKVTVTVIQEKNAPPVSNAGGDQSLTLPISAIYLNGTKSSDDLGIVRYTWTRDGNSLAIGNVVGNTSSEAVLIIVDVVPGRYVFTLTVADAQGLTSSDTVSIIVHPDPMVMNMVELTLTMGVSVLTQQEIDSIRSKLMLLLGDNTKLHMRDLKMEQKTGEAVLVFFVEQTSANSEKIIMPGLEVEKLLTDRFWRDSSILGTSISDVRTMFCQNKCSGHGVCNSETRACMCDTFWMPDVFYFWGIGPANCDWSILYVVIGVFLGFLSISGCCWGLTCMCRRSKKPRTRTKPQKYALLGTQDDEIPSLTRGTSLSDSETDSDVLFESRSKSNGILRSNGSVKNGQSKYSVTRLGRRIKT
ncbi:dyslexia-associated protein KIAA0319-like protein [Bradysia coprophila]|uniref:dyslexia-associated protein KIAA0319-like protein n=1 Tax=Bradysia coprophila TaxID=38358 RepID=UPI00187D78CD|nr:dyslexia-associated protein KIAA0319-like protein [Bradysia coprophila]